jgi:hypothetical protein
MGGGFCSDFLGPKIGSNAQKSRVPYDLANLWKDWNQYFGI